MSSREKKLIDLYVYCREGDRVLFLLLKRSKKKIYSNQWRMIGGKVKEDETRWEAALREMKEETGLKPDRFWSVPTLNSFYEHQTDKTLLIPAFAAEVNCNVPVRLDDEHCEYRWAVADEADGYIFWPEQNRIIQCINRIVSRDLILPEWKIDCDPI